jgi:multiple sugar transport system permease protein
MSSSAAVEKVAIPARTARARLLQSGELGGMLMLLPYILIFAAFVVYPVGYGLWLARHPASYSTLLADPIFARTVVNTLIFLAVAINIKMALALLLSGFFITPRWWIRALGLIFILPWALPSIPTILSIRFMLNPEWGIINSTIFRLTLEDGPNWLNDPKLALTLAMVVHIWKALPFWTVILIAGRLAISNDGSASSPGHRCGRSISPAPCYRRSGRLATSTRYTS